MKPLTPTQALEHARREARDYAKVAARAVARAPNSYRAAQWARVAEENAEAASKQDGPRGAGYFAFKAKIAANHTRDAAREHLKGRTT